MGDNYEKNNIVFIFNLGSSIICFTKLCKYRKKKSSGYEVTDEGDFGFRIARQKNNGDATVILYYLDYPEVSSAKQLSEMSVKTAPEEFKFLDSTENKRAYINKFVSPEGKGVYSFVGKKSKIKNCYIVIMHSTNKQLSNSELTKAVDTLLDEAENFLK